MRGLIAALMFVLCAGPAFAQQLLSPAEFRAAAIAVIRAQAPNIVLEPVDEMGVIVRNAGESGIDDESRVNFDSGYRDYVNNPGTLEEILARWSRLILAPSQDRGHDRIISVIRHRDMVAMQVDGREVDFVWRPFAGDLIELLAFDSAEQLRFVVSTDFDEIGLTPEAAWALTAQNIRTRMGTITRENVADGLDSISGPNGITPSLLALPDFCVAPETAGRLYLVADRNLVAIADARRAADRQRFIAFVDSLWRDGESMSATPLECRDGRLQGLLGD